MVYGRQEVTKTKNKWKKLAETFQYNRMEIGKLFLGGRDGG